MATRKNRDKNNLELIFEKVFEKSYKLRKMSPAHFDGQGFWQPVKKILEPLDRFQAKKWKKISKTKTRKIMLMTEYTINGYEQKKIDEPNHFIIQQARIPLNEKPTIKKIIQIALNIGQYKGVQPEQQKQKQPAVGLLHFIYKNDARELSKHISAEIYEKIMTYLNSV